MKRQDVVKLCALTGTPPPRPGRFERWGGTGSVDSGIVDRADAGWIAVQSLASQAKTTKLPADDSFRWIRAGVVLAGRGTSKALAKDVTLVEEALRLSRDESSEFLIKALLLVPAATSKSVAEVLGADVDVIAAFADLFFNVIDRRQEAAFIAKVVERETGDGHNFDVLLPPDVSKSLITFAPTARSLDDVMSVAGVSATGKTEAEMVELLRGTILALAVRKLPGLRENPKAVEQALRFAVGDNVEAVSVDQGYHQGRYC